jgi:3-(3-hydroxy-phenyl)propionate hydroxylase
VPIFGVRGLNNGLADAQNIGWKLGAVLDGRAGPGLLDSYTPERRGATMDVFANASKSARFMTPHTRGWALMRDAALALAPRHAFAGAFANPRNMTPYTYGDGPLTTPDTAAWGGGPAPGEVAHNVRLADGFLSDRLGPDFTLLVFGEVPLGLTPRSDLRILPMDPAGAAAQAYAASAGNAYLIRPDMHVAARWHAAEAADVEDGLRRALGFAEDVVTPDAGTHEETAA